MTRREDPGIQLNTRQLIDGLALTLRVANIRRVDLERKLGWSAGYVSRLFNGTIELRMSHLFALLRAVGLSPAEFFRRTFPPESVPEPRERLAGFPFPDRHPKAPGDDLDQRIQEVVVDTLGHLLQELGGPGEAFDDAPDPAEPAEPPPARRKPARQPAAPHG